MNFFSVEYDIEFVGGTLKGLQHTQTLKYPLSSFGRVEKEFQNDVDNERVVKGIGGSSYKILNYRINKAED